MSGIKMTTLPTGLRVITDTVESMHSVALGIWTGVGTRHENMAENGVAHMVEHMLFKGTPGRTAAQIAEQIENVGGSINAYTSREITSYHIHLLKNDVALGMDMLADMYQSSLLPDDEIERERQVILQEIGMNNDTPDDLVFDQYFEQSYPGQTMGAPILGRPDIISGMSRDSLQNYIHRFYSPERTVISAAGGIEHEEIVDLAARLFARLPKGEHTDAEGALYQGGEMRTEKDLEQAHIILGFEGLSRHDADYYAVQALSTLLGGGMSSRLFQEIREKRGLVYSIYSFHSGYQDSGLFGIYAGTGPEKLPEMMPVICDEVLKIAGQVTQAELDRAKAQLRASLLMGRESMMTRADQQAKHVLFRDTVYQSENVLKKVDAIDLPAIARVAGRIFVSRPTLAALGPVKSLESFDALQNRLRA
jgi:predicted Zn-dependent peptidase